MSTAASSSLVIGASLLDRLLSRVSGHHVLRSGTTERALTYIVPAVLLVTEPTEEESHGGMTGAEKRAVVVESEVKPEIAAVQL